MLPKAFIQHLTFLRDLLIGDPETNLGLGSKGQARGFRFFLSDTLGIYKFSHFRHLNL